MLKSQGILIITQIRHLFINRFPYKLNVDNKLNPWDKTNTKSKKWLPLFLTQFDASSANKKNKPCIETPANSPVHLLTQNRKKSKSNNRTSLKPNHFMTNWSTFLTNSVLFLSYFQKKSWSEWTRLTRSRRPSWTFLTQNSWISSKNFRILSKPKSSTSKSINLLWVWWSKPAKPWLSVIEFWLL